MNNEELKSKIFAELSEELARDGATPENTEVIEIAAVPSAPGRFIRLLRKVGNRFVTLVGKWGGLGFLIYVSFVQAVPKHTPIFYPTDDTPVATATNYDFSSLDLHTIELSGSAQLWIEEFGIDRPAEPITLEVPIQLSPGYKIVFVPANWNPPSSLSPALTGSFSDTQV